MFAASNFEGLRHGKETKNSSQFLISKVRGGGPKGLLKTLLDLSHEGSPQTQLGTNMVAKAQKGPDPLFEIFTYVGGSGVREKIFSFFLVKQSLIGSYRCNHRVQVHLLEFHLLVN